MLFYPAIAAVVDLQSKTILIVAVLFRLSSSRLNYLVNVYTESRLRLIGRSGCSES